MNIDRLMGVTLVVLLLAIVVMGSLEPTGLAKPLADLRDYNGAYLGAVGTGTIGYTGGTLYRDNQDNGVISGCRGEGCGRHPGVDIPVPSGTGVFAAQTGIVVISRCDPMWGGLVVIRSQHPWEYGKVIYYTYAHLRSRRFVDGRSVYAGDYVTTGTRIGESGGGISDVCAGRSTGPHIHFQIDRDDGNSEPYYPAISDLNSPDSDYAVASKTLNPISFVTGGYRWGFEQVGNRELWELVNAQSYAVTSGSLVVDFGFDPYLRRWGYQACGLSVKCSAFVSAEANEYRQVALSGYSFCSSSVGKVYFTTSLEPYFDENKSVQFSSGYGTINTHVRMNYNPKWQGFITGVRIDPMDNCNPYSWDPIYLSEITLER